MDHQSRYASSLTYPESPQSFFVEGRRKGQYAVEINFAACSRYACVLQIAATLSRNVLTPRNQDVKVLNVNEASSLHRKILDLRLEILTYLEIRLLNVQTELSLCILTQ